MGDAGTRRGSVTGATPDPLSRWRWIVVNSSGGKDSQTALRVVVAECERLGVDLSRVVVSHQCLGRVEWPGTVELVEKHALYYGLRMEITKYRDKNGVERSLLDHIRRRGKWPSGQQRYCTSDFKRAPGSRVITKLYREAPGDILNVYGFRAEESPARAKRHPLVRNERLSTEKREVWDWLPIHSWTLGEVWSDIDATGVPHHPAYALGMPRLSCCFCIFAPKSALIIAGRANRELLDEYCAVETEIGHTFQHGRSIAEVREAILAGEMAGEVHDEEMCGAWNM